MQYELKYLPSFIEDYWETLHYISNVLHAPQAANKLLDDADRAIAALAYDPKLGREYIKLDGTNTPYRRLLVKNHVVFYRVDDENHKIYIYRIVYGRRNLEHIIGKLPDEE